MISFHYLIFPAHCCLQCNLDNSETDALPFVSQASQHPSRCSTNQAAAMISHSTQQASTIMQALCRTEGDPPRCSSSRATEVSSNMTRKSWQCPPPLSLHHHRHYAFPFLSLLRSGPGGSSPCKGASLVVTLQWSTGPWSSLTMLACMQKWLAGSPETST